MTAEITIASCLAKVTPSGVPEREMRNRRRRLGRDLWRNHRTLVLSLDDTDLNGTHRLMIEALAKARGYA